MRDIEVNNNDSGQRIDRFIKKVRAKFLKMTGKIK